jgi:hypothetical protein
VHISNATHGEERNVVQKPSNGRVDAGVVDLVNVKGFEVVIAALPADDIEGDDQGKDAERCRAAPVDGRVAEKEVLDD